ncbi:hypothetical protein [Agromyces indicus]|uniref:Uncharacterized protein n=1 Tax=Agromyces indicus TaxID=758919 RepID=A0ABU1FH39_9MICO|nr:hypothetical protein [Agromyces indicus]MDR5691062.1 hypothetical protein [Agromyces indicus]
MKRSTKHLDGLGAFALADAIMAELGNPSIDEIEAGERAARAAQPAMVYELAATFDAIDESDDLAVLLEELDAPAAIDARARELRAINRRRERIIRKHFGSGQ